MSPNNFQNILQSGSYWDYNTESTVTASDAVRKQAFSLFDELYQAAVDTGENNVSLTIIDPAGNTSTFTLAGFYFNYSNSDPIFAQSVYDSLVSSFGYENSRWEKETNYVVPADAKYCAAVFSFPSDTGLLRTVIFAFYKYYARFSCRSPRFYGRSDRKNEGNTRWRAAAILWTTRPGAGTHRRHFNYSPPGRADFARSSYL